jgi:hypothetical protein
MTAAETDLIVDYFLNATPEHLEMLGVDPSRLPPAASWRERRCMSPIPSAAIAASGPNSCGAASICISTG